LIQEITRGIRISVKVKFEGSFFKDQILNHAFMYFISIENKSKDVVQVLTRNWRILESSNHDKYISGDGIVGKKPVIKPEGTHIYHSGCLLTSSIGSMSGTYVMINFTTGQKFNVKVPSFKLCTPQTLN
tara:strand:+ start:102 stop:488 length:387 start_codon:yes stop_codon:yes gene_type:complete